MMLINVSCWGQSYPFEPSRLKRLVKSDSAEYFLNGSHLNINTSFLSEDDVRIDSVRRDDFSKWARVYLSSDKVTVSARSILDSVRRADSLEVMMVINGILVDDTTGVRIHSDVIESMDILKPGNTANWIFCSPPKTLVLIATKQNKLIRLGRKRR
jgi:hypothetical protein